MSGFAEKPLPHDVDGERSLVGLLCEQWQPDAANVPPAAFYDPRWRAVSVCAHALNARGEPVNAERLDGELRTRDLIGEGRPIASISDVTECMNNIPPGETGATLAARIHDAWQRRRVIEASNELAVAALNDHAATWKTTRDRVARMLATLAEASAKAEDQNSSDSYFVASWPAPPSGTAYYGLAGDVVRLLAPHTEADPFALLLQFLVYFGAVIGPKPHFLHENTRHAMNLFAVLVGPTGKGRKGTSHDRVAALYRAVDAPWMREHVLKGLSSGEGLIAALRDHEDETSAPDPLRKAVLVYETEFAAPLEQMSRQGNILSSTLRQAWDADTLGTLTRNDPLKATGVHVAMVGHITRDDLQRYMTNTLAGNGLGNRIIWAASKRAKTLPFGGDTRPEGIDDLEQQLRDA